MRRRDWLCRRPGTATKALTELPGTSMDCITFQEIVDATDSVFNVHSGWATSAATDSAVDEMIRHIRKQISKFAALKESE